MTTNKTTIDGLVLTIALKHAGTIKVQTALIQERYDLAREYLTGYIEQAIEDGAPQDADAGNPAERAAVLLDGVHGPLLQGSISRTVEALIPNF